MRTTESRAHVKGPHVPRENKSKRRGSAASSILTETAQPSDWVKRKARPYEPFTGINRTAHLRKFLAILCRKKFPAVCAFVLVMCSSSAIHCYTVSNVRVSLCFLKLIFYFTILSYFVFLISRLRCVLPFPLNAQTQNSLRKQPFRAC